MADKIIRNVDEDIWRQFTGYCKMKNVIVGKELTRILKEQLRDIRL